MTLATSVINIFAVACLIFCLFKDRDKTKRALAIAAKTFLSILPAVLAIIIVIGLILGFVPQEKISEVVGERAGFKGILLVALFGAVLHIPSLISFPLAASLLKGGASVSSVAVFIASLTMIGVVTLPLEIRELGRRFALLRNALSFIAAIIIGLIIGAVL